MLRFAVKRALGAIPTLFLIIAITFFMMRLAPGGPFDKERKVTAEVAANLTHAYHLDEPLFMQFGRYLGGLLQGDFGPSFQYKDFNVSELIWRGFHVSWKLGLSAMVIAFLLGVSVGSLAALRQNSIIDYATMGVAMTGIAIPNFVMAPVLTLIFGLYLRWLPVGGWGDGDLTHAVLPVARLPAAGRHHRAPDPRQHDRGAAHELYPHRPRQGPARADRDLPPRSQGGACCRWSPISARRLPTRITGSVIIEQIFGMPGIGRYFVQAALNRDYTLVLGSS